MYTVHGKTSECIDRGVKVRRWRSVLLVCMGTSMSIWLLRFLVKMKHCHSIADCYLLVSSIVCFWIIPLSRHWNIIKHLQSLPASDAYTSYTFSYRFSGFLLNILSRVHFMVSSDYVVCLFITNVNSGNGTYLTEMLFAVVGRWAQRNHVLDRVPIPMTSGNF